MKYKFKSKLLKNTKSENVVYLRDIKIGVKCEIEFNLKIGIQFEFGENLEREFELRVIYEMSK